MRLGERCLIADGAFAGSEITVFEHYAGDGDLIVGDRALKDCKKLTTIKLGDTEIIGNYAFRGCIKEPLSSGSFLYSPIKIFML